MKTIRSVMVCAALVCVASITLVTSSFAADSFATPDGAGDKNGSSWANAHDRSQIQSAANALAPGDTLHLGSGTYGSVSLTLTSSGEEGRPKSIVGADTGGGLPLMLGAWSELTPATAPAGSSYLIRFSGTVSHWVIKDLKVRKYAVALTEVSAGTYSHLTIDNLDADTVRDGITLVSVANSSVKNCDIIRHTKKAFRLTENVNFVTYENCTADATGGDDSFPTEVFPNGFYSAGNPGIHDITFIDCVARNQRMAGQPPASYWNGDGFSTENSNYNFTYLRCQSFDNDDGGFDDKARNVTYDSCVAIGNKRAFRYWGSSAVMVNCLGAYSKSWGDIDPATGASMPAYNLWVSGQINVSQSTFHNGIDAQVYAQASALVILNDSILSVDGTFSNGALTEGNMILNGTKQFRPGAGLDADPAYVAAARTWTGSPVNAFDSQTYASPEKGYFQASGAANHPPSLTFTALPHTQHMVPFTLNLTPTAVDADGTITSYAWHSGDGATSSAAAPSFVYSTPGTFTVTCTVTDNSGAIAMRTISVRGIKPNAGPDHYVTPTGAGNLDGSSWSHAYSQAELQALANSLAPGDTIHLGSGTYANTSLILSRSGTESAPIVVQGVDTGGGLPVFAGTFNPNNSASGSFLSFGRGEVGYLTIKNLRFQNHGFVIDMVQTGTTDTLRHHITFQNLSFDSIEDAIRLRNASNILVKNCHAIRYTKKAYRVGDYSSFVTFQNCSADCNGGDDTFPARSIPNGFFCDDIGGLPIIHDILFVDCVTRNNRFPQSSGSYWNGDGFSSERGAYNVTFLRCESYDNHDGGFDNKCSNAVYQDCISAGNSRGFRHWGPAGQMINCVIAFNTKWGGSGSSYGLWVGSSTGQLNVSDTTIHDSGTGVYTESGATASVLNSILSTTSAGSAFTSGSVSLIDTATWRPGLGIDPAYLAPDPAWRGVPANAMDSGYYGTTKGFNSTIIDAARDSIGVNLTDANNSLAPTDIVGVVAAANWNNSTVNNQVLADVVDSAGTATTADVSFSNTAFAYNNNTAVLDDPMTDDAKMMRSQRGLSNSSSMSVTAAQVPYENYDVYVYWGGRAASQSVPLTMTLNFQLWNGSAWVTNESRFIRDTNRLWDGTYEESTATSADAAVDGEDYVVFRNVSASTFRVAATAATRAGLSGLQIVERGAPHPRVSTPALSGDFATELRATNPTGSGTAPLALVASGPATVSSDVVTLNGAGPVAITATPAGDANTLAAGPVVVSSDVAAAPTELVLGGLWQLYDGQPKPVTVDTTLAGLTVDLTYNGSATPPVYPGYYHVEAVVNDPDFTGSASGTLVISTSAVVRHAPVLNGRVQGSVHVLSAASLTLNGGAFVSGDLLLPGTPAVRRNGQPNFGGTIDGPGDAQPLHATVVLNGNSTLRHVVRRIDPVAFPVVLAPPAPAGTRTVSVNNATQNAGDFATLRDFTLNSNAGLHAVPPGNYGSFTANANSRFILGIAGATEPAVYNLQSLTLDGNSAVQIVGPVILTLATGTQLNGSIDTSGEPERLLLRIASGGLTLNGNVSLEAFVDVPNGTVTLNGNSTLTGGVTADRLTINRGGMLIGYEP